MCNPPRSSLGVVWDHTPLLVGQRETEERGRPLQATPGWWVAVSVSKGHLYTRLVLGTKKTSRSLQVVKVNIEVITRFGHIYCARCSQRHNIISRLCPWSSLWEQDRQVGSLSQGQGWRWRAPDHLGLAHESTDSHIFSMTFPHSSLWFYK